MRARVMGGLAAGLNFLILNLLFVIGCIPVVTIPLSIYAATKALLRWRCEGEDRVVREFLGAWANPRHALRATTVVGVPVAVVGVAVGEMVYFVVNRSNIVDQVCFGLGVSTLVISLAGVGYTFVLATRYLDGSASQVWRLSLQLGLRNLFVTGPLFLAEVGAAVGISLLDPGLLVLGVPILLLNAMRATADRGLSRAGLAVHGVESGLGIGGRSA